MLYRNVTLETIRYELPEEIVTSAEIERRLKPTYERLGVHEGRLELMSGIRERRFWPHGTAPGTVSARSGRKALDACGIPADRIGCLIHASVSRDYLEPATACGVHHALGLPKEAMVFDLSNACLGFLNGMTALANMIELGQIEAGLVVATESSRDLVDTTIADLNGDESLDRNAIKLAFASLTIGSGSAAAVLAHRSVSRTGNRLLGGGCRTATEHHEQCRGGPDSGFASPATPRMRTDSEGMLQTGCALAAETWKAFKRELGWSNDTADWLFGHQVGAAHRRLLRETLQLDPAKEFSTLEWTGNTGSVAAPMTAAIAIERGTVGAGDQFGLLGIGSGLNSIMLAVDWHSTPVDGACGASHADSAPTSTE